MHDQRFLAAKGPAAQTTGVRKALTAAGLILLLISVPLATCTRSAVTAAEAPATGAVVAAASGSVISGTPGPNTIFPVTVASVEDLGAATVLVGYDPALLKAVACQRSPVFDVGLCNLHVDRNSDGIPDAVKFAVGSIYGVSTTEAIPLFNITWQAVTAVAADTMTFLTVQVQTFKDIKSLPLAHTTRDGQITLLPTSAKTPTPTATPTATATATSTATATATSTATSTATPTSTATLTATATETPASTATLTATATKTPTSTATLTATATETPASTATLTATATETPASTATPTATATETPASTATPTTTATETPASTATPTTTATPDKQRIYLSLVLRTP